MAGTVEDFAKWDLTLNKRTLLHAETLAEMWTPAKLMDGTLARVDGFLRIFK